MGAGIAQVAARAGFEVVMHDIADEFLKRGATAIDKSLQRDVDKERLSVEEKTRIVRRVRATTDIGALSDAFIVVEATLGGTAFGMPLLGGTMFDGVRYYGLPNAFISILLGSALLVAAALNPVPGTLLLFGVGLFAGFPGVGADVGADGRPD